MSSLLIFSCTISFNNKFTKGKVNRLLNDYRRKHKVLSRDHEKTERHPFGNLDLKNIIFRNYKDHAETLSSG